MITNHTINPILRMGLLCLLVLLALNRLGCKDGSDGAEPPANDDDTVTPNDDDIVKEVCGDGIRQGTEVCDDGEICNTSGYCLCDCSGPTTTTCGDGVRQEWEACEPGERFECHPEIRGGTFSRCNTDCTDWVRDEQGLDVVCEYLQPHEEYRVIFTVNTVGPFNFIYHYGAKMFFELDPETYLPKYLRASFMQYFYGNGYGRYSYGWPGLFPRPMDRAPFYDMWEYEAGDYTSVMELDQDVVFGTFTVKQEKLVQFIASREPPPANGTIEYIALSPNRDRYGHVDWDWSGCGNGTIEGPELCDGPLACVDSWGHPGHAACSDNCQQLGECIARDTRCGDGIVNGEFEECDDGVYFERREAPYGDICMFFGSEPVAAYEFNFLDYKWSEETPNWYCDAGVCGSDCRYTGVIPFPHRVIHPDNPNSETGEPIGQIFCDSNPDWIKIDYPTECGYLDLERGDYCCMDLSLVVPCEVDADCVPWGVCIFDVAELEDGYCMPGRCGDRVKQYRHFGEIVGQAEECDDGNTIWGDGCTPECRYEQCGNGVIDIHEVCEEEDASPCGACNADCTGDGVGDCPEWRPGYPTPREFQWIEPGSFMMGSPESEADRQSDELLHEVTISKGFFIQKRELTSGLYGSIMGENVNCRYCPPAGPVSWRDAIEFCNLWSVRDYFEPCYVEDEQGDIVWDHDCTGYRLPTEAEWEYAARAGTTTAWYCGDDPACLADYAWSSSIFYDQKQMGGGKEPNGWGLQDMHGNMSEWCWDWYDADYYLESPLVDPRGPASGEAHVVRGGAFDLEKRFLRSAQRAAGNDANLARHTGFRVVRNIP